MVALLTVVMIVGYSLQPLFTRLYSTNYAGSDAGQSTTIFSICFGGLIGLATLVMNGFHFAPVWQTVVCGAVNAALLLLFNMSMIEAGNRGSYSFMMICSLFGCIIVPLTAGALFLGESINALQGAAIVLMLISFVVMNARSISLKGSSGAYYFWCAVHFLVNGLFATLMNLQQKLVAPLGIGDQRGEMLTIIYLGMSLAVLAVQLIKNGVPYVLQGMRMGKKSFLYVVLCSVVAILGANSLLSLLSMMDSGILYTLENGGVLILSAIFSFAIFKEKPSVDQLVGIVLAIVSIVMLSL